MKVSDHRNYLEIFFLIKKLKTWGNIMSSNTNVTYLVDYYCNRGRRVIGISRSLNWSKALMDLIFNPCGEFRGSPEGPVSEIHSPHLHVGAPGNFPDLLRSVQMLKRKWGAESNGK